MCVREHFGLSRRNPQNVMWEIASARVSLQTYFWHVHFSFSLFFSSPLRLFLALNVHISLSPFIMGPECSSSQMSSPVAEWEGEGGRGQRKAGNVCLGSVCVCVEVEGVGGAMVGGRGGRGSDAQKPSE